LDNELAYRVFLAQQDNFEELALEIFLFQYAQNKVYRRYVDELAIAPREVDSILKIPFLPISLFKSQVIKTSDFTEELFFQSSGTTGAVNSRHFIKDAGLYKKSFLDGFRKFYGRPEQWCIVGLLPSYLERKDSSLIFMVDELIRMSGHAQSNFYLYDLENLAATLRVLEKTKQKTLLIGVTYALLEFAEKFPIPLHHTTVMETGGMKGRRRELTRKEVHDFLKQQFGQPSIHSEYSMTELLSQAYSSHDGIFQLVPWMRVCIRNEDDPLEVYSQGTGIVNIIDLANAYSCSFIATDDVGTVFDDGAFEIQGRIDGSDLRGCNLLVV
jgi:Acyl-protein synthetase, LuxE